MGFEEMENSIGLDWVFKVMLHSSCMTNMYIHKTIHIGITLNGTNWTNEQYGNGAI